MSGTSRRGNDDDREIDRVGNVADGRVGPNAGDRCRGRMHRVHRPLEAVLEQVAEQLVADLPRLAARTDHRDRTRCEQPGDRRRLRLALPGFDDADRNRRRRDREARPGSCPRSKCRSASQPASVKTFSIFAFPGSVSARNVVIPFARGDPGEVLEQQAWRAPAAADRRQPRTRPRLRRARSGRSARRRRCRRRSARPAPCGRRSRST